MTGTYECPEGGCNGRIEVRAEDPYSCNKADAESCRVGIED